MGTRREGLSIQASDPDGGKFQVNLRYEKLQWASRYPARLKETIQIVPHVLQQPAAIFEGLRRDFDEDKKDGEGWRCYSAIPHVAFNEHGELIAPYRKQVFLVFINTDKIAYNWRWDKCDPFNINFPLDHSTRFKRQLK